MTASAQTPVPSRADIVAYIRQAAAARGIDPGTALRVARSEGLNANPADGWQSNYTNNGVRETSYGPYQLLVGGGLGDIFTRQTGLDPTDPLTVYPQIDFALDYAAQNGWGSWYGAGRAGIGNRQGLDNAQAVGVTMPTTDPTDSLSAALLSSDPMASNPFFSGANSPLALRNAYNTESAYPTALAYAPQGRQQDMQAQYASATASEPQSLMAALFGSSSSNAAERPQPSPAAGARAAADGGDPIFNAMVKTYVDQARSSGGDRAGLLSAYLDTYSPNRPQQAAPSVNTYAAPGEDAFAAFEQQHMTPQASASPTPAPTISRQQFDDRFNPQPMVWDPYGTQIATKDQSRHPAMGLFGSGSATAADVVKPPAAQPQALPSPPYSMSASQMAAYGVNRGKTPAAISPAEPAPQYQVTAPLPEPKYDEYTVPPDETVDAPLLRAPARQQGTLKKALNSPLLRGALGFATGGPLGAALGLGGALLKQNGGLSALLGGGRPMVNVAGQSQPFGSPVYGDPRQQISSQAYASPSQSSAIYRSMGVSIDKNGQMVAGNLPNELRMAGT